MDLKYYIIDDLRLPPKRPFHKGWTMEQFRSLQEALVRYRAIPACQVKSIGVTDGVHVLELVRCLPIYPAESTGEDVQAAVPDVYPLWQRCRRRPLRQRPVSQPWDSVTGSSETW